MNKEKKMQDIKERLDLFPSNMNEPAQKAYCELFDYINNLEQQVQKQKEVIDKIFSRITLLKMEDISIEFNKVLDELLDILKEVG